MKNVLCACALLVLCGVANAANICADLNSLTDSLLKDIATANAGEIGDNSAPRHTSRLMEINNDWLRIQLNMTMAQQHKCPPRDETLEPAIYFMSALTCANDRMRTPRPDSCNTANWGKAAPEKEQSEPAKQQPDPAKKAID